eukprot:10399255-Alexandrium_andersonii.AAC.1
MAQPAPFATQCPNQGTHAHVVWDGVMKNTHRFDPKQTLKRCPGDPIKTMFACISAPNRQNTELTPPCAWY